MKQGSLTITGDLRFVKLEHVTDILAGESLIVEPPEVKPEMHIPVGDFMVFDEVDPECVRPILIHLFDWGVRARTCSFGKIYADTSDAVDTLDLPLLRSERCHVDTIVEEAAVVADLVSIQAIRTPQHAKSHILTRIQTLFDEGEQGKECLEHVLEKLSIPVDRKLWREVQRSRAA